MDCQQQRSRWMRGNCGISSSMPTAKMNCSKRVLPDITHCWCDKLLQYKLLYHCYLVSRISPELLNRICSYLIWSYLSVSICIYPGHSLLIIMISYYIYPIILSPFSFQFSETSQLQFCWCPLWDKSRCLRSTSIVSCVAVFPRSLFTKLAM